MEIAADLDRFCIEEEVQFTFDSEDNITAATWEILNRRTGISETMNTFSVDHTFALRGNYRIEFGSNG